MRRAQLQERPARGIRKTLGAAVMAGAVLLAAARSRGLPEVAVAQETGPASTKDGPAPAAPFARSAAVALARLEPANGLISVGARPGVRVDSVQVKEGDQVSAGVVVAVLEGHASAEQQLGLALAQKRRADEQRSLRKDALKIERAALAETNPVRLEAARKVAKASRERAESGRKLYGQFGGTLKGKELYDAEMALFQAELQATRADLDLRLLESALKSERAKHELDDRELAEHRPDDDILEAQIALARAGLRDSEVRAPSAGKILRVLVRPGEISPGALLEMGDVSSMVAVAELYHSDVPRIRLGDPAVVDILGSRVGGKVTRISSIVGRNQLTSVDPRALRDLRVVAVTIQLEDAAAAARYVSLEVDAVIRPSGSASTLESHDAMVAGGGSH
jgi:HlyD family secretion protein